MERLRIREAGKLKIEWCCDVLLVAGVAEADSIVDAVTAMHNAQATYLRWVHGVNYRGPGEMFCESPEADKVRISMRWAGSVNQAHRLARRDPAFHAVGEQPKPLMIGGAVVSFHAKMDLVNEKPIANVQSVGPVLATEDKPPTPAAGLEMSPPEVKWPKDVMSVRKIATGRGIDTKDINGKGSRKRIIERLEAAEKAT